MSHPECNLKIEYKKRLIPQSYGNTPVGANSVPPPWSPDKPCVIRTTYVNNVCYPRQHLCFHKPCRGAAQFLLCRNPTSHYFSHVTICAFSQQPRITTQRICRGRRPRRPAPSTFRIALLFIPQTMTTTQRMVGANIVRPFRFPTQLREKSKP